MKHKILLLIIVINVYNFSIYAKSENVVNLTTASKQKKSKVNYYGKKWEVEVLFKQLKENMMEQKRYGVVVAGCDSILKQMNRRKEKNNNSSFFNWKKVKKKDVEKLRKKAQDKIKERKDKDNLSTIIERHQHFLLSKVTTIEKENRDLKTFNNQLIAKSKNVEIDNFLNREDTLIFNKEFQFFNKETIPYRSKKYYSLIKRIHQLDSCLLKVEKDIIKIKELEKNFNPTDAPFMVRKIRNSLNKTTNEAQRGLDFSLKIIDEINIGSYDNNVNSYFCTRKLLTNAQWDFFANLVDNKYNQLKEQLYQLTRTQ